MRKTAILILAFLLLLTACGRSLPEETELIVVGLSQVGSESSWRVANSESMKEALSEKNGYELIFDDAKNKQENQYKAIRTFIQQGVDYIVLAPTTETGWDDILAEVKAAGIPVIIVDRKVRVSDDSLYTCWVGSNFMQEGIAAAEWLDSELAKNGRQDDEVRILHLQGTLGSTSQLLRTQGLDNALGFHTNWTVAGRIACDYTEAKGYEATKEFLMADRDIDVIYSENDNMSFGAIRALSEAGLTYGRDGDVMIISFDSVRSALQECLSGNISLCVECNPLHGPRVAELIQKLETGEALQKMTYVEETWFTADRLTQELIDQRPY